MKKLSWLLILALLLSMTGVFAASADEEVVTLTFMGWEASPLETESVLKGIETFQAANPNIKVEYNPINGDYNQKLLTMIAGDAAPDTFFMGADQYRNYQLKGALLDLTDYFFDEFELESFIPSSAAIMNIDGHIYGVSSCTVNPAIYYNADLFDAAGVEYPPKDPTKAWTWDEFVEAAVALTKFNDDGSTDVYGVYGIDNDYARTGLYYAAGGRYYNEDITAADVDNETFRTVMQQIKDLREVHKASPQNSLFDSSQGAMGMSGPQMLQTGKIAMFLDGSWVMQELAGMGFNVGVGCLPKMGSSDVAISTGQAHVHSAWEKTQHPDEAWRFLAFLSSEEYQLDLVRAGLWMPNRTAMYEPDAIERWYNKDVYGEGYELMAPYFRDAIALQRALNPKSKCQTIISDELNLFFSAESMDMEDLVANITTEVNNELSK